MAGIDLVLFDILLAACPQRHSASYIALYQTTTYVATFAAPILGTFIAEQIGYAPALFVSGGLRFAGAILFVLLGVGATVAAVSTRAAERPATAERGAKG
jgi:MFS family permease